MTDRILANKPTGPVEIPEIVRAYVRGRELEAIWLNELGGLTFRDGDRYLKWNPIGSGLDLERERARLDWAGPRHPVPEVVDFARDDHGQLLVTAAMNGTGAVSDSWRARPRDAVNAIAEGLRLLHALPAGGCPFVCPWAVTGDVLVTDLVVVQGDPCAPNTIIGADARFAGHVDLGYLGVADRWADLAVASMSLDWNYGPGWQDPFFEVYGVERDEARVAHFRELWRTGT